MTIIQPVSKYNSFHIAIILFFLLITAGLYVYQYNAAVVLRHKIRILEKEIIGLESMDSELKSGVYALIDPNNLENLADKSGLVFEKKPDYLNLQTDFKDLTRR